MAGEVRIPVGLNTDTALQDAKKLEADVKKTLSKVDMGTANSKTLTFIKNLTSAYNRMQKLADEAQRLSNTKLPTEDYAYYNKQLEKALSSLTKLQAKQNQIEQDRNTIQAREKSIIVDIENAEARLQEARTRSDLNAVEEADHLIKQLKAEQMSLPTEVRKLDDAWTRVNGRIEQLSPVITDLQSQLNQLVEQNEAFTSGKDSQAYKEKAEALNIQNQVLTILLLRYAEMNDASVQNLQNLNQETNAIRQQTKATQDLSQARIELSNGRGGVVRGPQIHHKRGISRGPALETVDNVKFSRQGETVAELSRYTQAENDVAESTDRATESTQRSTNAMRSYGSVLGDVGKNILARMKSALNRLVNAFKQLSHHLHSSHRSHSGLMGNMKHSLSMILRYTLGIRSLFMLIRRIRSYTKEAFKVMAQEIPEVNQNLSQLGHSFKELKAGFGTMLQPLLKAITPLLDNILQKIVSMMNAIGKFFATLAGQDYVYEATVANYDYAESVKAAEEANNGALASFDKLNVIAKDDAKNTLALTKDTVTYKKVEINPDESWFTRLAKKIADGWKKADLSGATNDIAKKIAELLDSISWENIRSKTTKFAHTLATGINGITLPDEKTGKSALAVSIGNTIAEALQTAIDTFDEFITTINWSNLGKFIGDAIDALKQRLRDNDSWRKAGMAFGRLFQGLVELGLELFVKGNIFEGLGTDLADMLGAALEKGLELNPETGNTYLKDFGIMLTDAITKFLDEAIAFLDNTSKEGKLAKAVNELFLGIDLLEIAKKLVVTFLKGFKLGLQLLISGGLGALGIEADEGTVKLLAEALGIGLLAKKIGGLVGGITGSNGLLSAFGKKDRALDTQSRKLGLEKIAVGLLTGVLGALGIQALTTSDELDVLTNEGVGSAVTAFEGLGDKVRDANKSLGEETEGAVERARLAFENLNLKLPEVDVSSLNVFEQYAYSALQRIRAEYAKGIPEPKITKAGTIPSTPLYNLTQSGIKSTQTVMGQGVAQTEKDNTEATDTNTKALDRQYEQQQAAIKATQEVTDVIVDLEEYFGTYMKRLFEINKGIEVGRLDQIEGAGTTPIEKKLMNEYETWREGIVSEYNTLSPTDARRVVKALEGILNSYYESGSTSSVDHYLDSLTKGTENLLKWLPSALGAIFGVPLPALARGAVLPPNKPFLAMVGDQKTGTNVEAPLSTIEQAVANVIAKMGIKVVFDVKGDPNRLFKAVQKEATVYSMQYNKSAF